MTLMLIMGIIILAILANYFNVFQMSELEPSTEVKSSNQRYIDLIPVLKDGFKSQDADTWIRINAAVKRVLKSEQPARPSAIILMYDDDGRDTAHCLVQQLSDTITRSYGDAKVSQSFDLTKTHGLSPDDFKKHLDDKVRALLDTGSKVVVLEKLHGLNAESAKLLHGYCDTDGAPYKDAHFLFTLHTPGATLNVNKLETLVEQRLQSLWESVVGSDNIHALLSRISNSVVFVKPQENMDCS